METPSSPAFLNTTYSPPMSESFGLHDYFKATSKLGSYSVINVHLNPRESVQVVVDAHLPWLQAALDEHFGLKIETLTLDQVEAFITWLRGRKSRFELQTLLGLAPHRRIGNNKFLRVLYLDDIKAADAHHPLVLSLFMQMLFERYTRFDSRVAVIETRQGEKIGRSHVVLLRDRETFRVLDASGRRPWLHRQLLNRPLDKMRMADGTLVEIELLPSEFRVTHPKYAWNEKTRIFSIISGTGKELAFAVTGRTPAEKRFKREYEMIQNAPLDAMVPIEIGFHPFWRRLGHTTLRIGEALYEFSNKGWRVHNDGADTARAYLFNNPFFKAQYAIYAATGMPPISLGVTMLIPKEQLLRLQVALENLCSAEGPKAEKFSLMRNNCNQGIMRVLTQTGIEGFQQDGYLGFSSVLSFRRVLLYPPLPTIALQIYPLPGSEVTEANLRRWVPRLVYRYNTVGMEMTRALPSLLWDAIVFFAKKANTLIARFIRIRPWNDTDLYHMNQ